MSLNSTNFIPINIKISNLYWVIKNLGYKETILEKELKNDYRKLFFWEPPDKELTYVGIELYVSKNKDGKINISTKTRAGRSFAELTHQNLTIKTIQSFFGGTFETDYGKNKYLDADDCNPEKSEISMALYIQRWKLHNALVPIQIYSEFIKKAFSKDDSAGNLYSIQLGVLPWIDCLRPCVVSSNIQLPYIIGAWENFVKNSYLSILKYGEANNKIIKPEKLSAEDLEKIRTGESTIEECIVGKFSFQRPQTIINNFQKLDSNLDVNSVFVKPYKNRKTTLKSSIDKMITLRNKIVHDGFIDAKLTDKQVYSFYNDIIEASNRLYRLFAKQYKFKINFDF